MSEPEPATAVLGLDEAQGLHRFAHEAMATVFEVVSGHEDAVYAAQAAHEAFALVDRLEQELSRFRPNSDVSRVNELQAGQTARVSPDTMECLVIARHVFELTGGAFDVSIGSGLDRLELDAAGLAVHARAEGARLDLGGIGKGFAVDRMAALLQDWGLERSLLHGGYSSVLALEPPAGRDAWALDLRTPGAASPLLSRVAARQTALSASGTRKGEHILDPRDGRGVADRAVFVLVPRGPREEERAAAAVADALSTAFMILPVARIQAIVRENPGLEVYRLDSPGTGQNTGVVHLGTATPGRA